MSIYLGDVMKKKILFGILLIAVAGIFAYILITINRNKSYDKYLESQGNANSSIVSDYVVTDNGYSVKQISDEDKLTIVENYFKGLGIVGTIVEFEYVDNDTLSDDEKMQYSYFIDGYKNDITSYYVIDDFNTYIQYEAVIINGEVFYAEAE